MYGSSVNLVALIFLLCGISNITRTLGIGVSLVLMPIIYGAAILGFVSLNSRTVLFMLMASLKSVQLCIKWTRLSSSVIFQQHKRWLI